MNEISEKKVIEDTLEKGFQASEMRFLSKEPTMYKDLKKEILQNKNISNDLKTEISQIVKNSIDFQVKKSLDHAGSSFLKELQSLRFSDLDDHAEKLSQKRKSMDTVGVQIVEMDENGDLQIQKNRTRKSKDQQKIEEFGDFDMMMEEILGKDDFDMNLKENEVKSSRHNEILAEPDRDFLFESQEMESKLLTKSSKRMRSPSPNVKPGNPGKFQENENINYSDYYDNVFNSFLLFSGSQARNSNMTFGNSSNTKATRDGIKPLNVSAGLSQFLRSKIESFVEEYSKEAVYKKGSIESMIKGMGIGEGKNEANEDVSGNSDFKQLKLDDDENKKLILSDLETIEEHHTEKIHKNK